MADGLVRPRGTCVRRCEIRSEEGSLLTRRVASRDDAHHPKAAAKMDMHTHGRSLPPHMHTTHSTERCPVVPAAAVSLSALGAARRHRWGPFTEWPMTETKRR